MSKDVGLSVIDRGACRAAPSCKEVMMHKPAREKLLPV
jgi:hypothetical protein